MTIFFIIHSSVTLFLAYVVYRSIIKMTNEDCRLISELNEAYAELARLRKELGISHKYDDKTADISKK